jgi:uncharacterized protein YukE
MADENRKNEIYAELSRLKEVSRQLEEIAESVKKLAEGEYENSLLAVKESWSGDNAQIFLGKAGKIGEDVADTARKLSEAARTLVSVAQTYADAEVRAIEVAKQ